MYFTVGVWPNLCSPIGWAGITPPSSLVCCAWIAVAATRTSTFRPSLEGEAYRQSARYSVTPRALPRTPIVGGWARGSTVVDKHYIDPTFRPTPAAHALYGWLLSSSYSAGPGTVEVGVPLPDPWLEPADS